MRDDTDDGLTGLVIGLAIARYTDDRAGWAALRHSQPVSDSHLFEAALEVIIDRALIEDSEAVPGLGADAVLRRWALEAAG